MFLIFYIYYGLSKEEDNKGLVNKEKISPNLDSPKFQTEVEKKKSQTLKASDDSLLTLIGKDAESLKTVLGEPNRIDPSYYDYEWWVYNKTQKNMFRLALKMVRWL